MMLDFIVKNEKKKVIIILMVAFVFGMLASGQYGSYIDQYTETNICGMNIKEYMLRILGDDKPHHKMEYMFITTYGNIGRISESVERDHGVALYYPIGVLVLLIGRTPFTWFLWHYYTFIFFYAGCLALYGIMYEFFHKQKLALVAFSFLFLSPRFFAEGHYNNKDIVLMAFGLLVIYFGIRYILRQKFRDGILFALTAAIMTNAKIIGLWFWGVIGIAYLIYHIREQTLVCRKFLEGIGVILIYVLSFVLITPASWDGLIKFIRYCIAGASSFSRWSGSVLYAGERIPVPLPWHYLPVQILISSPLPLLLFCLLGHIRLIMAIVRKEKNAWFYVMCFVLYIVPFVYAMCDKNLVVYNGWRHFYFIYGPLMIFAGVGCEALGEILRKGVKRPGIKDGALYKGICGCTILYLLFLIVWGHPYQYSYVNCLALPRAEERWELDYWNVTGYQTLRKLYNFEGRNTAYELTVGGAVSDLNILPESWRKEMRFAAQDDDMANYIVVNRTYSQMNVHGYHFLFDVEAYGNCLYEVYERDERD